MEATVIMNLIQLIGWPGLFIFIIIYLFVLNSEKGEKFIAFIAGIISHVSKKAEKTKTAYDIQGKINSFIRTVNTEVTDLMPYGLKIKWISEDIDKDSFIKGGKVVVMLRYHQNQDENLSLATLLYVNKSVIPEARPHINFKLCEAIDLIMTKKVLYSFVEAKSSFNYFVTEILHQKTDSDVSIKEFCTVIDKLDERGLFTRVLLRELSELGERRAGITETGDTVFETGEFTKFLDEIARKERGEDVPLTFSKNYIKVAIILVARPETGILGVEPFIKRVKEKIKLSINVIYIFAWGSNVNLAKEVYLVCKKMPELVEVNKGEDFPIKIDDRTIEGFCVVFRNRKII